MRMRPAAALAVLLLSAALARPSPAPGQGTGAADPPSSATGADAASGNQLEILGHADYGWRVRSMEGEETTLEAFRGEVLFINLWASWCTPCVRELGSIERLQVQVADSGVRFLVVAAEREASVRRFLRRHDYDLPFYLEVSRMPPAFGMRGIPTSWVVDRSGRIVLVRHGAAVWDTAEMVAFLRSVAGHDR